eukprot:SAG31_NODE_1580_length_7835_cov_4.074457_4_plen_253_part_00
MMRTYPSPRRPHGNTGAWPFARPDLGPIKAYPSDCAAAADADDLTKFVNAVMVHQCSSCCLRRGKKKPKRGKKRTRAGGAGSTADGDATAAGASEYKMECRMGFGYENPRNSVRTDGRRVHPRAMLETRRGVTRIDPSHDHPRVVAGPHRLARQYCANLDMQVLLALVDDYDMDFFGIDVADGDAFFASLQQVVEALGTARFETYKAVRAKRSYLDPLDTAEGLSCYVNSYACKAEISAAAAARAWWSRMWS